MGPRRVKLRLAEVAAQAEVSEATVSRVLNNKPGVSESTRASVLTAIDVLGFEVPERLRPRVGALIGLITPELTNPIFPAFAQTIESGLAARGFTSVLCTQTPAGVHEDIYVQMLLDRGVAGIICISGQHADTGESVDTAQLSTQTMLTVSPGRCRASTFTSSWRVDTRVPSSEEIVLPASSPTPAAPPASTVAATSVDESSYSWTPRAAS